MTIVYLYCRDEKRGDFLSPRTGRPLSGDPRVTKVETRMSNSELEKLDHCCKATGKSRSEVIRLGIDIIYAKLEKPQEK